MSKNSNKIRIQVMEEDFINVRDQWDAAARAYYREYEVNSDSWFRFSKSLVSKINSNTLIPGYYYVTVVQL